MNPYISNLQPYPFEKLRDLLAIAPAGNPDDLIDLSIGEPKHGTPELILEEIKKHAHLFSKYPTTGGLPILREAITQWLSKRFPSLQGLLHSDRHVLPVNGTREGLFAIAQALIDNRSSAKVMMPNPFYQIYEGAAVLAGAEPIYINFCVQNDSVPALENISPDVWKQCQMFYICSPANPSGEIIPQPVFERLIQLANEHEFIIVSDECYSEIYRDEDHPPQGLLHACCNLGNDKFKNCLAFYSLSKRSNAPGLRSGCVAGDDALITAFLKYRTYHGCAMPLPVQYASIAAWADEHHVIENRQLYREKFDIACNILSEVVVCSAPSGGFYIWMPTPIADPEFALRLYNEYNVRVLPGSFLSRATKSGDPGAQHIRIALVAPIEECRRGIECIAQLIKTL